MQWLQARNTTRTCRIVRNTRTCSCRLVRQFSQQKEDAEGLRGSADRIRAGRSGLLWVPRLWQLYTLPSEMCLFNTSGHLLGGQCSSTSLGPFVSSGRPCGGLCMGRILQADGIRLPDKARSLEATWQTTCDARTIFKGGILGAVLHHFLPRFSPRRSATYNVVLTQLSDAGSVRLVNDAPSNPLHRQMASDHVVPVSTPHISPRSSVAGLLYVQCGSHRSDRPGGGDAD